MGEQGRRIASNENRFVREGVEAHKPTTIAPTGLFAASEEDDQDRSQRIAQFEDRLAAAIGKPFYSADGFFILQGDCAEILPALSRAGVAVDLTVTSPPYNIGKEYEEIADTTAYVDWCTNWMRQIHVATAENGALWLNLGYFEVPEKGLRVPIPYLLWNRTDFYLMQEVAWNYGAGVHSKKLFAPRNEKWLFYVRNQDAYTFNLDAVRDPNVKYPNQKKMANSDAIRSGRTRLTSGRSRRLLPVGNGVPRRGQATRRSFPSPS